MTKATWRRRPAAPVAPPAPRPNSIRPSKAKAASRGPRPLLRHLGVAMLGAALVGVFWATRPTWSPEMRLWKAVGDAAFVLLLITLSLGPLARLTRSATRLLPWRRQTGIWFAVVATIHGVLVVHGWARVERAPVPRLRGRPPARPRSPA